MKYISFITIICLTFFLETSNLNSLAYNFKLNTIGSKNYNKLIEQQNKQVNDLAEAITSCGRNEIYYEQITDLIQTSSKIIKKNPQNYESYLLRACAKNAIGNKISAIDDLESACDLKPNFYLAYNNLGTVLASISYYVEALKYFDKGLKLNPKDYITHYNEACTLFRLNELDKALIEANTAVSLNPKFVKSYFIRGHINTYLHHFNDAIKDYKKTIELEPKNARYYFNLAKLYYLMDNNKESIEYFKKSLALNPDYTECLFEYGRVLLHLKEYQKARNKFIRAIKMNTIEPDPDYYFCLGLARYRLKEPGLGVDDFSHAIRLYPNYPRAYLFRAQAHFDEKKYSPALDDIETALNIDPKFQAAIELKSRVLKFIN